MSHPIDVILKRRSIRKFKDKLVPYDNIITILKCGVNAPIAGNINNTKLIVIREPSNRKAIAKACHDQAWIASAPAIIAVVAEPENQARYYGVRGQKLYTIQNAASVTMNMIYAAEFLGLSTCWVSAFDEDELRYILALPEEANVHTLLPIGFADEKPSKPPKKNIQTLTFFEKWWAKRRYPAYGFYSENVVKAAKKGGSAIKKLSEKLLGKDEEEKKKD